MAQMVGAAQDLLAAAHMMARLHGVEVPPSPMELRMGALEDAVKTALMTLAAQRARPAGPWPQKPTSVPRGAPRSHYRSNTDADRITLSPTQPWAGLSSDQVQSMASAITSTRAQIHQWAAGLQGAFRR